ncbi:MAG TPA: pitrilysin family protein [Sporichthyaceae bacterium]
MAPRQRWSAAWIATAIAAIVIAALLPAAAPGLTAGSAALSLPTEAFTLGNGLRVILAPDRNAATVTTKVTYRVGAANETAGSTGFAHLFEHMMFTGSGHIPLGTMDKLVDALGSYTNAATTNDYTDYVVPDLPPERLDLALWFESDRMGYLLDTLDAKNLATQQAVVRNELRQNTEQTPYGLTDTEIYHQLFPKSHPYYAAVIGSHRDVQAATLSAVRTFFRTYYVPNNAILSIAGNLDPVGAKASVTRYFGTIPRGADPPRPAPVIPQVSAEKDVRLTDAVALPRLTMAWLTSPYLTPGDAAGDLTAELLAGGESSLLYRSLVRDRKIAQDVTAYQFSYRFPSVFEVQVTAKPGHTVAELQAAVDEELTRLRTTGPAQADLDGARNRFVAQFVRDLEDLDSRAQLLNRYDDYFGTPDGVDRDIARHTAVSAADTKAFATDQLRADGRVVIDTEPGPRMATDDPKAPPIPTRAGPAVRSAEAWRTAVPGPGSVLTATIPGVRRFTLRNVMPVYLVESHRLPLVTATVVSRYGSAADPAGLDGLATVTAAMLRQGTPDRTAEQLSAEVAGFGGKLTSEATSDGATLSIAALSVDAGQAAGLLASMVRHPALRAADLTRTASDLKGLVSQQNDDQTDDAQAVSLPVIYGKDNPYGHSPAGSQAGIDRIKISDVAAFHDRAWTPNQTALVLSGDLTLAQASGIAGDAFGDWTGSGPPPPVPPTPAGGRTVVALVDTPGSTQTALRVAEPGPARTDPDYEPLQIANQILGGLFSSRLSQNLRERHGYTYGAYARLGLGRGPAPFAMSATVEARHTGDSVKQILAEFNRWRDTEVTAEELDRGRQSLVAGIPALFSTTDEAARLATRMYLFDLSPDHYQQLPGQLAAVTAASLRKVIDRQLVPGKLQIIAVGDRATILKQLRAYGPISDYNADGSPR